MANQQLGMSAPPAALRDGAGGVLGAVSREHTPRRRRLDTEAPGRSPVAKRPAVYQAPIRQLSGTIAEMSNITLTNEVAHHRDVIDAMHTWILMYVCTYVRTYVCMYVCMYVCVYVCMQVCTHSCMYA